VTQRHKDQRSQRAFFRRPHKQTQTIPSISSLPLPLASSILRAAGFVPAASAHQRTTNSSQNPKTNKKFNEMKSFNTAAAQYY